MREAVFDQFWFLDGSKEEAAGVFLQLMSSLSVSCCSVDLEFIQETESGSLWNTRQTICIWWGLGRAQSVFDKKLDWTGLIQDPLPQSQIHPTFLRWSRHVALWLRTITSHCSQSGARDSSHWPGVPIIHRCRGGKWQSKRYKVQVTRTFAALHF